VSRNVHEATVVSIKTLARGVVEWLFRTDPPGALTFRPGQFISVRVGEDTDGAAILRSYSLASPPGGEELALILKLVEGGAASTWFSRLQVGDRMRFTGPMGFFVLDLQHVGDVVFGVTGVGMTPVLPMLDELLQRAESGRVTVYWGNRAREDLFWQTELEARQRANPRLQVRQFLTSEATDWGAWHGERGRITPAILADLPQLTKPIFYLVGNGQMIRDVKAALVERGVDRKKQIRNEAFFQ